MSTLLALPDYTRPFTRLTWWAFDFFYCCNSSGGGGGGACGTFIASLIDTAVVADDPVN